MATRWESQHNIDPSTLTVDLGARFDLSSAVIHWEAANADSYTIEGSNDNSSWTTLASKSGGAFGNRSDEQALSGSYRYVRMNGASRSDGNNWGYSIYEFEIYGSESTSSPDVVLVSGNASATASTALQPAGYAVDGNSGSRWESSHGLDPSWITIDLGSSFNLSNIEIDWEAANAESYDVQGSNDGSSWTTLKSFTGGQFGNRTDSLDLNGSYRYVRIYGTTRSSGNSWGYSIYEARIYGY
jgi:hypothetical protein